MLSKTKAMDSLDSAIEHLPNRKGHPLALCSKARISTNMLKLNSPKN